MDMIEIFKADIERKLPRYLEEKIGWLPEKTFTKFNTPEAGKKWKLPDTDFDFSSVVGLSPAGPDKHSVAEFMKEELGKDYESSWMGLSMPKVKKSGNDSFGSLKTFTPGEMCAIRGMPLF